MADPNVDTNGSGWVDWFDPGDSLGPRPAEGAGDGPSITLTGFNGKRRFEPANPLRPAADELDQNGKIRSAAAKNIVFRAVVPLFRDSTCTDHILVWAEDILHHVELEDGRVTVVVRADAVIRDVRVLRPADRDRLLLEGRVADLLRDLDLRPRGPEPPPDRGDALETYGRDCPASLAKSHCPAKC
jgi:hypothetical protein